LWPCRRRPALWGESSYRARFRDARSSSGKAAGRVGRVARDLMLPIVLKLVAKQSQDWLFSHHIDWDARLPGDVRRSA
jgi:hypothetical protein